jgi:hypothetical protein
MFLDILNNMFLPLIQPAALLRTDRSESSDYPIEYPNPLISEPPVWSSRPLKTLDVSYYI